MTKSRLPFTLALCLLLISTTHAQISEQKAIEFVKHLSTTVLDSTLPQFKFSEWLAKVIGDKAVVLWELNDCGEQTGNPAVDSLRDTPSCVGIYVTLPDQRKLGITIAVGTYNNGFIGQPEVFDMYLQTQRQFHTIRRLSDLPGSLKQYVH